MFGKRTKIHISKSVFYSILAISLTIIVLIAVNGIIYSLSDSRLNTFLADHNYTGSAAKIDVGERHYRMLIILRLILNSIVFLFFAVYSYLAFTRIKVAYGYTMFWSFIFVGNILGAWLIPGADLWFKIVSTIASGLGIAALFNNFIVLNQMKFYSENKKRWGS